MGSRSRRYLRSLRRYRRFLRIYCPFLRSYRGSLQRCRNPRQSAAARAPIIAWLAKHHKTLLNIVNHYETHVKHHEPLVNHRETLKTLWNIMKQSSFDATKADDIGARCGDVGARCGDVCVWGSDVGDRAEVIRCDDIDAHGVRHAHGVRLKRWLGNASEVTWHQNIAQAILLSRQSYKSENFEMYVDG